MANIFAITLLLSFLTGMNESMLHTRYNKRLPFHKLSLVQLNGGFKVATTVLLIAAACNTYATNGYYTLGYSAKDKGTAGTSIARGRDALSMATNPATMLQVGDRFDLGLNLFMPAREYTVTGAPSLPDGFSPVIGNIPSCAEPGSAPCQIPFSIGEQNIESGREIFFIPNIAYVTQLDEDSALGVSLYGNGGMNTTYAGGTANVFDPNSNQIVRSEGTFGSGRTGVDLTQLFINVSYAWRFNETLDLGVALIGAVQAFRAEGLAPFANNSLRPDKLTNNGHDFSFGLGIKLGAVYQVTDDLSFGLSYQSEQKMSKFEDYSGLFAQGGDFDMPASYTIGLAYDLSHAVTLKFDYQKILYEGVPSVSNSVTNLVDGQCLDALNNTLFSGSPSPATGRGCLGGENGAGFGWNNMDVFKAGVEWYKGETTYRAGISATEQPIDSTEVNFNILAPGVIEYHLAAGLTTLIGQREWTFFGMYMPSKSVRGTSLFDPAQTIEFNMHQFEFGLSIKF
jgi:long-chain fatty acid transport protein